MRFWPEAAPLDPSRGAASPALESLITGAGAALPALVLVAAPGSAWARHCALAIAERFVATGRRIVLADAGMDSPSLHRELGHGNDQGLVDHVAFGTSLERLARPAGAGAWSLLPAGPPLLPSETVLGWSGWRRLFAECAARETTLLFYAPAETPGLAALVAEAGATLLLLGEGRSPDSLGEAVPRAYSVLAAFSPAPPEPAGPAAEDAAAATGERAALEVPRDLESRQALIADLRARQRAALQAPPADAQPPAGTVPSEREYTGMLSPAAAAGPGEPPEERAREEPPIAIRVAAARPPRRRLLPLLLLLLLLSVLAGTWHWWGRWRDARTVAPADRSGESAVPAQPVLRAAPPPARDSTDMALPYLVAIAAYAQLPAAQERIVTLTTALPGTGFLVVPLVRDGSLYYHVMAGPAADSSAAQALMDTLIARRLKTGGTPGDVRHAPLAFLIGEYATQDSAQTRVAALRRLDIPSYRVPHGDAGSERVYAGGYAGPAEADVMRQLLESVGVSDSLVTRTGRTSR